MSERDIQAALVAAYQDVDDLPTAYEGFDFTPPDSPWNAVFNLRSSVAVASLGVGGQDEHAGVFQIDINEPLDTGTGALLEKADAYRERFPAGARLPIADGCVDVTNTNTSPLRRDGAWLRVSVSVFYIARINRPEA